MANHVQRIEEEASEDRPRKGIYIKSLLLRVQDPRASNHYGRREKESYHRAKLHSEVTARSFAHLCTTE